MTEKTKDEKANSWIPAYAGMTAKTKAGGHADLWGSPDEGLPLRIHFNLWGQGFGMAVREWWGSPPLGDLPCFSLAG